MISILFQYIYIYIIFLLYLKDNENRIFHNIDDDDYIELEVDINNIYIFNSNL